MEKETLSYLKLFEFIKNNGNKELLKFIEEYNNIKDQNIIDLFIFENIDLLKKLLKDNKKIIELLRNIKTRLPIENNCFKQNIEKSINNIDLYINNINLLHSLNIDKIKFPDKRFIFTFHLHKNGNRIITLNKQYSNENVSSMVTNSFKLTPDDVSFRYEIFNPNYLIDVHNNYDENKSYKTIYINDLGTDLKDIPSLEELENKDIPDTLKKHLLIQKKN